jgi:glycine/D-amino acid oxidase-like deaminating enzyme
MARTDAIMLGAGIVGTSIALHLAKRSLSIALIDRAGVGEFLGHQIESASRHVAPCSPRGRFCEQNEIQSGYKFEILI